MPGAVRSQWPRAGAGPPTCFITVSSSVVLLLLFIVVVDNPTRCPQDFRRAQWSHVLMLPGGSPKTRAPWRVLLFRRPEHRLCHSPCEGAPRAVTGPAQKAVRSGAGCCLRTEGTMPWCGPACDDICSQGNPSSVRRMDEGHWSHSLPGIISGYVVALILECGCHGNRMWLFVKYSGCSILCCPVDRSTLCFGKY